MEQHKVKENEVKRLLLILTIALIISAMSSIAVDRGSLKITIDTLAVSGDSAIVDSVELCLFFPEPEQIRYYTNHDTLLVKRKLPPKHITDDMIAIIRWMQCNLPEAMQPPQRKWEIYK